MPRRIRVTQPSPTGDRALDRSLQEFTKQINLLPGMSIISTSGGPESNFSGDSGDIAIDVGSSATTFWGKTTGSNSTTGWQEFQMGVDSISEVKGGSLDILVNVTTTVVTHGMAAAPTSVMLTPKDQNASNWEDIPHTPFISAIGSTTFTANWDGNLSTGGKSWYWLAVVNA